MEVSKLKLSDETRTSLNSPLLTRERRTQLRVHHAKELVASKPSGSVIKLDEFMRVLNFPNDKQASAFIQRLVKADVLRREKIRDGRNSPSRFWLGEGTYAPKLGRQVGYKIQQRPSQFTAPVIPTELRQGEDKILRKEQSTHIAWLTQKVKDYAWHKLNQDTFFSESKTLKEFIDWLEGEK